MTVDVAHNGHVSVEVANLAPATEQVTLAPGFEEMQAAHMSALDGLVADVEVQLRHEQHAIALLESMLIGYREREKKLSKAMAALKGEPLGPGRPPKEPERDAKKQASAFQNWKVSETKQQLVLNALREMGGEQRVSHIADAAGCTPETARRALITLRERELVRLTRQDKKFGKHYAVMPTPSTDQEEQRA